MPFTIVTNVTLDIYRGGNAPPAAPDVSAVKGCLLPEYADARRNVSTVTTSVTDRWTHTLLLDVTVDLRDGYSFSNIGTGFDTVYIPDKNGTPFRVRFVERVNRGKADDHQRVYLDRGTPAWPSSDL
ncbi:MAG: hypothetical protein L0Z62_38390 [Gemmataceae bacterium]|nr:hypothetical protein [Gemmataceae bacterium]